jgi:hydrogenase-4 component E
MELLTSIITALILLTAFILLMQNRIHSMINTFIWQSILLATVTLLQALRATGFELYISVLLTVILKVIFIPYLLRSLVYKLNIRHKVAEIKHPFLLLIGAAALVLFCYHLIIPIRTLAWNEANNIIAVAMAVMLLGMLLLITHRKAISHVIGFMSMENGIFFAALIATQGMPMVVELGIAFDVLIAAVLFGVFFLQLRRSIDSLDVDRLNLLREDTK